MQINWTGFYMTQIFNERCFLPDFNRDTTFSLLNSLIRLVFTSNQCCKVFFPNIFEIIFETGKQCKLPPLCKGDLLFGQLFF